MAEQLFARALQHSPEDVKTNPSSPKPASTREIFQAQSRRLRKRSASILTLRYQLEAE